MNTITISGIIETEISLRESKTNGTPVSDFRIAHRHERARDRISHVDVVVWGNAATNFHRNAQRGDVVVVQGELRQDVWEKDGERRTKHNVTARRLFVVNRFRREEDLED